MAPKKKKTKKKLNKKKCPEEISEDERLEYLGIYKEK